MAGMLKILLLIVLASHAESGCVDLNLGCGEWAEEGLCKDEGKFGQWMRESCQRSCDPACASASTRTPTTRRSDEL